MFRAKPSSTMLARSRLSLEALEDRCLLSGNILQTNLVSDLPGVAKILDPKLVNPWGISEGPSSPFWISDSKSGLSTLYNTPGKPQALAVGIPSPGNQTPAGGTSTGTVFNIAVASSGFMISDGIHTAPAIFLFATQNGTIAGWNPWVDPMERFNGPGGASTHAVIPVDNSTKPSVAGGAVYTGLAIATDASGRTLLYAANFRSGQIDVFDTGFNAVMSLPAGAFTDTQLPTGFAPFNIQTLGNQIYVTYAKQDAAKYKNVPGLGNGFIDVYNLDGSGGRRLVSGDGLDSPWGLAIAPSSFGIYAGKLLVGNFGNGRINVFDTTYGTFFGTLMDPSGTTLEIDGLWALQVGNGNTGGNASTVYFTAGLDKEQHGLFGSLTDVIDDPHERLAASQIVPTDSRPSAEVYAPEQSDPTPSAAGAAAGTALVGPTQAREPVSPSVYPRTVIDVSSSQDKDTAPGPAPASAPPGETYPSSQPDTALAASASAPADVVVGPSQTYQAPAAATSPPVSTNAAGLYVQQSYSETSNDSYTPYADSHGKDSYQVPQAPAAESIEYQATPTTPKAKPNPQIGDVPVAPARQLSGPPLVLPSQAFVSAATREAFTPLETDHSAAGAVDLVPPDAEWNLGQALIFGLTPLHATLKNAPDKVVEELVESADATTKFSQLAPQLGSLLGGAVLIDLANLKVAIDGFFARIEDLAEHMGAFPDTIKLVHWLLVGATATGAFELARRRTMAPAGRAEDDRKGPLWAPFPVLAVLPPED